MSLPGRADHWQADPSPRPLLPRSTNFAYIRSAPRWTASDSSKRQAVEGADKVAPLLRTACPALNPNRRPQQASLAKSVSSFVGANIDPSRTSSYVPRILQDPRASPPHRPQAHLDRPRHQAQGNQLKVMKLAPAHDQHRPGSRSAMAAALQLRASAITR